MADAIAALDGTQSGTPHVEPYMQLERGMLSTTVFDDIDAAIRAHDGALTPYAPSEMAAAILALTWDTGLKARALLLDDGTLEFNYRNARSSDVGTVSQCWEVDPAGYTVDTDRPWSGASGQVKRVIFDSDWHDAGVTNYAYWCCGMATLAEVRGFEEVSGCTDVTQMFTSCTSLDSIYATSFDNTAIASAASVLYGCNRLVGGTGFVPTYSAGASALSLGGSGVLTDPANDGRTWLWAHLYGDGDLEITTVEAPATQRVVVASGRICANAHYRAVGCTPWYARQSTMRLCRLCSDLAAVTIESMDYWFYSNTSLLLVTGWDNVHGLQTMQHTFNGCSGITMLDLTGLDPSALANLSYAFASCSGLQTIYVDGTWALPAGCTGMGTFYGCTQIQGGNGTTYSASATGAAMMRIDATGTAGYLTGA